jgi:hypothetical protein
MKISVIFIDYFRMKYANRWAYTTVPTNTSQGERTQNTYIEHCGPGHRKAFPGCESKHLAGHGGDEDEAALGRDRHLHPVTSPRRIPHTLLEIFCLYVIKIGIIISLTSRVSSLPNQQ